MPTFTYSTDRPTDLAVDVLVLPVFEGPQAGPGVKDVRGLDLLELFSATGAKGKRGESLLVPNTGVKGLAAKSQNERFAYDSYRRFIQMYADVVLGVDHGTFEGILENYKNLHGLTHDTELSADDWRRIVGEYKEAIETELGKPFPQDTTEQLWGAIAAVFGSWQNARAVTYRRLHAIPDNWGTAVNVQAMVFGNMGDTSATGVAFTRNPSTGANEIYGEYLVNAQGEDVVAGIRTPQPLTLKARREAEDPNPSLEEEMPFVSEALPVSGCPE